MKKILFIIAIYFCLALPAEVLGEGVAQESIISFDSQINIQKDATANITEIIHYNFGDNQKHGIFRDIPTIITNKDGKRYKLNINVISVSDKYKVSTVGDNLEIKIGDANKLVTGDKIYTIKYSVVGNVRYFSDHDEFYWNVTGNSWEVPIYSSKTTISIPENSIISDAICFTGVLGSTSQNCTHVVNNNSAIFSSQKLNPSEGISVDVSFPKNVVDVVEPQEKRPNVLGFGVILIIIIFYYLFLPFYIIYRWFQYGRDPKTNPNIPENYDPPGLPAEVGTLVDESADNRDISATILDLAIKGYLKIKEEEKNNFSFIKLKEFKDISSLKDYEKDILTGVFKLGDKTTTKSLEITFYDTSNKVKEKLYEDLIQKKFFETSPEMIRQKFYLLGGFALFTFNLFLAFICFLVGKHMPRKTLLGAQTNIKALGLKKFLSTQSRQLEFQAKNWMFFEKLLPYAVIFGVEKIWAERFKDISVTPPDWYESSSFSNFNTLIFINSLDNSLHNIERVSAPVSSTTSSSGFSSGFSGGGFSGGGGGGGGGGSW